MVMVLVLEWNKRVTVKSHNPHCTAVASKRRIVEIGKYMCMQQYKFYGARLQKVSFMMMMTIIIMMLVLCIYL